MTGTDALVCEWCGNLFKRPTQHGPIPKFCKASHRKRAFEERQLAEAYNQGVKAGRRRLPKGTT